MSDVALIMALPNESKGLFEQAGIEVHYSGIGKVNAAYKAFEVIQCEVVCFDKNNVKLITLFKIKYAQFI